MVNKPATTHQKGSSAEQKIRLYLESRGLRFVEANYRWRGGELDLVMLAGKTLVLVEVRSATTQSSWLRYSVTRTKQQRLLRSAHHYRLKRNWARGLGVRFDLVWLEENRIEHWPNVLLTH